MQFKLNNEQDNGSFDGRDNKGMSRRNKILLLVFIFILTNVCSVYVGNRMSVTTGAKVAEQSDDGASYQKLFEVQQLLEKYYYKDIDQNKLVEGAIKGLADSLGDPYTVFMNKKEYDDFNTTTVGAYVGVGLQVGVKDDKITVIAPFDNSPAKAAGIATGDVITKVNDKDVAGKDLDTAVSMMKGKEGEDVALTLYREGKGSFQVTVKRAKIDIKTVKSEMLPGNIGYIQLTMWDEKSYDEFTSAASNLKSQGMKGLILDLRDNPGGLLSTCVNISSQFVDKGKLVVSQKNKAGQEDVNKAVGGQLLKGIPLVVLINGGTASASEIFSGMVRDYKLGTLIGTKSFGKGVVQTIINTGDGTALKVTISKYYTPNGENIDKIGINPDIVVDYPKELLDKPYDRAADPQFNKALEVIKDKLK